MTKRNLKLGILSLFLVSSIFFLAGCGNRKEEKNQNQNQNQNQEQIQANEPEKANEDDSKRGRGNGKMEGNPPAEMTEACKDKVEGDSCQIDMPARSDNEEKRTMAGTCEKGQNSDVLSCHPSNMPPREGETNIEQ